MSKIAGSSSSNRSSGSGTTMDDEKPPKLDLIESKFSDALRSRTIKIISLQGHEFFIHEELLCRESEKFKKQLRGDFKEAQTGVIPDVEEPPELLGIFFEYLYREGWVMNPDIKYTSQYPLLVRLYCMGERLCAESSKEAVLWKFETTLGQRGLSDDEIVDMLAVVHTELPPRKRKDYPLRCLVLWYVAAGITRLKDFPLFRSLVSEQHPELGAQLLLLAGNSGSARPSYGAKKPEPKFQDEVDFV
ncbi:hypothetical protein HDK90DRAFT_508301 [Phyllosticta capitalensis]|uniref:BTB domain-containing protein n=1 Tax=Phyllosticta capitalensis TaxID=121624 RepID=A0ABR1Z0W5_9PEZI